MQNSRMLFHRIIHVDMVSDTNKIILLSMQMSASSAIYVCKNDIKYCGGIKKVWSN